MHFEKTKIKECIIFINSELKDKRGKFSKFYSKEISDHLSNKLQIKEVFMSSSQKNVIRGMHFQTPPYDQDKLVTCIKGSVLDVFLDIRKKSKTFAQYDTLQLSEDDNYILFLPKGIAHGFKSLENDTELLYMVTSNYSEENDTGIHYNSFGFNWESENPILSERDLSFSHLKKFKTPFL